MVECRDEADRSAQQHAIAKDVTGHVAAPDDRYGVALDVDPQFREMPLDGNPCSARGNAHRLMVISIGAAGRESVPEPVALLNGYGVGHIRKGSCALVGCNDEIGIVLIVAHRRWRMNDRPIDDIIGEGQ